MSGTDKKLYPPGGMGAWSAVTPAATSWCAYVDWQKQYSFDPLNGTQGIPGSEARIMGGESALWAEQVDETNLESLLWPRAAAGAEGQSLSLTADLEWFANL